METPTPAVATGDLAERIKRADEKVKTILAKERLKIVLNVKYERGPDAWIKAVPYLRFVDDKG